MSKLKGATKQGYDAHTAGRLRTENPFRNDEPKELTTGRLRSTSSVRISHYGQWRCWNRGWHLARIAARARPKS